MALTRHQIGNIADDAVNLLDALKNRELTGRDALTLVQGAMLAIVMNETENAPEPAPPGWEGDPAVFVLDTRRDSAPWPTAEQQDAKQEQLTREQARMGNVTGKTDGIHPDMLQLLAFEPEKGQEMRLVAVTATGRTATAEMWVQDNVPDAGAILSRRYAGRDEAGSPVYLVTYQLLGEPPQRTSEFSSLTDD